MEAQRLQLTADKEGGWLYKGDKMDLLTLTKHGLNMKMALAHLMVNFGWDFQPFTISPR